MVAVKHAQGVGRIATDIGGTFTDLIYIQNGEIKSVKCHSTPGDFEKGIENALGQSKVDLADFDFFAHGSTVVINALTERKGVKTGLITTLGFRDVLEIARGNTPDIFNNYYRKPLPFVPRHLRLEVHERIDHCGEVTVPLAEADVLRAAQILVGEGVRAIAVCFLHAYANPVHERRTLEIIADVLPDVYAIASHQVCRQWREYERTNTTVLSAYVLPPTRAYLAQLQRKLSQDGLRSTPLIMQSNGGLVAAGAAAANPISLVESGPVAGVMGAAAYAQQVGESHVITLDIGGTTAKCALVHAGEVRITTDYHLEKSTKSAGYPINIPVVDIVEIGNGGGSIAWMDKAGGLHVGPRSAGASPGPVAYGRGGIHPTTTDAHLLLGRIDPEKFVGGGKPPELDAVSKAFSAIAEILGVGTLDAALGTVRISNSNMVNALKLVSVNRGHDPRDFSLVAFGGGAGLHAVSLAAEFNIPKVIIPPHSAVFSAWAMLMVDQRRDHIVTAIREIDRESWQTVRSVFEEIEQEAQREFDRHAIPARKCVLQRFLDLRYTGQEHTVKISYDPSADDMDGLVQRFHAAHEREFTFGLEHPVEIVNFHLAVIGQLGGAMQAPCEDAARSDPTVAEIGSRQVFFDDDGRLTAQVYDRSRLVAGMELEGPAVVEERDSVIVVPPRTVGTVDAYGGLHLHIGGR